MRKAAHLLALSAALLLPARAQAQDAPPSDASRLFIGPSGRVLAPGQGYITFDGLLVATIQVGVTREFSLGGGSLIMPIGTAHPFWVTPKVQLFRSDRTHVAAGVIHMFIPGVGREGFAYTVGTIGSLESSVTVGGGVLYFDESGSRAGPAVAPVIVFGGERRYKPRVSFITENYLGPHGGLVSGGVRWRLAEWQINLAGILPFAQGYAMPGGWFGFAYKFGGK